MNELRIGKATVIGEITLIPLFRIELNSIQQPGFMWLNGSADPFAVVFIERGGVRAQAIDESDLEIEDLVQHLPELEVIISQFQ
jgi:hypothetical protein